jgi:hypothetical protein
MLSHLTSYGATYSRASTATYVDANGLIKEASVNQPRPNYNASTGVHEGFLIEGASTNLNTESELFTLSNDHTSGLIIIPNQAIAPDAKANFTKIIPDTTNVSHFIRKDITATGTSIVTTIYAKADGYDWIRIRHNGTSSVPRAWFNLSTGQFGQVDAGFTFKRATHIGDGVYRIEVVEGGNTNSSGVGAQIMVQSADSQTTWSGDGVNGILIWGLQLEEGSFASSYIPTIPSFTSRASTATYVDSNGNIQTASVNEERTENHVYIDGQWVDSGQLLEGNATNIFLYSEDLDEWIPKLNCSISIDGTLFGLDKNLYTNTSGGGMSGSSLNGVRQDMSLTSGAKYTWSFFVEKGTSDAFGVRIENATRYFNFTDKTNNLGSLPLGSDLTVKITDYGSDKYKFAFTWTADATETKDTRVGQVNESTVGSGTLNATVYFTGFQLETSDYATSYIPTSGSAVTRSADVFTTATKTRIKDICYIDGTAFTDFYNASEGTILCESILYDLNGDNFERLWDLTGDSLQSRNSFRIVRRSSGQEQVRLSSKQNNVLSSISTDITYDEFFKTVVTYNEDFDNADFYKDGVSIGNANNSESLEVPMTKLSIGMAYNSASQLEGSIKSLVFFPKILTEAQKLSK